MCGRARSSLALYFFSKPYLWHAPPPKTSPNASGAQQVMCDFIQVDDIPGESGRLNSACVSSSTGVCFDTKLSEWKGVENVTRHLRPSFQSIQPPIRRSGRLPCLPRQLLLLAKSENAEFITCNQLQVEVDFAVFLGFSSDREMVGSMQSCSYSQRLTSIELLYAELRRGPIMTTDEKPRAAQTAEGIMSLVLGKPVVVHNWRNGCEWGAFPTHSA